MSCETQAIRFRSNDNALQRIAQLKEHKKNAGAKR